MQELYETTSLTKRKVAQQGGYIDWATQPSCFKHYPDFLFSYAFGEKKELEVLELSRCVTQEQIIASKPYLKLCVASAGNLHPVELYVQIRGIKGIISGIYHVDAAARKFVLLQEIEREGFEPYLGLEKKFHGMLCFVSAVPFRSFWKYGERAYRYIYLDIGHQIASIVTAATLFDVESTILSDTKTSELNALFGFREDEMLCGVVALGAISDKSVQPLKNNLFYVAPTNYSLSNSWLQHAMKDTPFLQSMPYEFKASKESILRRRSAREFEPFLEEAVELRSLVAQWQESAKELTCHELFFQEALVGILLDQHFVKHAQRILVVSAKEFSSQNLMLSGAFVHKIYLDVIQAGMACSAIGAFYDRELQKLLETNEYILCVCAIGNERKR